MSRMEAEEADVTAREGGGYAWEEKYKRSWDLVQEDAYGSLQAVISSLQQQLLKKKRITQDAAQVQRGIIRFVYLLVDGSQSMAELDLKPTRIEFSLKLLTAFVDEFFDQNPLSQMGIILTRDGLAEKILDLTGNPSDLKEALSKKNLRDTQGDASLQNSLELAVSSLCHVPSHGSREIISVYASLSTCDPSDISKTLSVLKKEKVRVSIVGLAAEVQICKRICEETSGNYGVILDDAHYRELLFLNVSPPALDTQTARSSMIRMGFPPRDIFKAPQLCSCHMKAIKMGYTCPQCQAIVCDIPMDCPICSLSLVSSPFLARSYHHLFPVPVFNEIPGIDSNSTSTCHACLINFPKPINQQQDTSSGRFECPTCRHQFCLDCDIYIHQNLHVCPGCD